VTRATYVTETKPPGSIGDSMAGTLRSPLLFAGRVTQPAVPIMRAQSDKTRIFDHGFAVFRWAGRPVANNRDIIRCSNTSQPGRHQTTGLMNRLEVRYLVQPEEYERSEILFNCLIYNDLRDEPSELT
jgi:hypothetical protein